MDFTLIDFLAQQSVGMPEVATNTGGAAPSQSMWQSLTPIIMMLAIFGAMYFLVIRPQRKEEKKKKEMLSQLKKGDSVVTISGIIGTVHSIKDETVFLNIGDNTKVEFLRSAISSVREAAGSAAKGKQ